MNPPACDAAATPPLVRERMDPRRFAGISYFGVDVAGLIRVVGFGSKPAKSEDMKKMHPHPEWLFFCPGDAEFENFAIRYVEMKS